MTILIICKDKKGWVLGSDTHEIDGRRGSKIKNSKFTNLKIQVVNDEELKISENNFWIGLCGYGRVSEFINNKFNPPKQKESDVKYIYDWCKELKNQLEDYNLVEEENNIKNTASFMIVLYNNQVYEIDKNFGITQTVEKYYALGCAEEIALGSLYTSKNLKEMDAEERVKLALESCTYHDIYINDDYDIFKLNEKGELVGD